MRVKIKTQDDFLDHTTSISNFIFDAEKKGNLLKEDAERYYDLIEQLENVFDERWVKDANDRLVTRLRNVD